jgi:phage/plasmid-associated DNA primase
MRCRPASPPAAKRKSRHTIMSAQALVEKTAPVNEAVALTPNHEPLIEWDQFDRFRTLLGRDGERVVLAIYPPDPRKPNLHIPVDGDLTHQDRLDVESQLKKRAGQGYSLGMVINRCGPRPDDWGKQPEHFRGDTARIADYKYKVWNGKEAEKEPGERFKCKPRTFGASNKHIQEAVAVWFECDGGLVLEAQEKLHELIGLPEPTMTVWTGGKSLHVYYVLRNPIDTRQSERLMLWMCKALERVCPDCKPDYSIKSASRLMRVPGGRHGTKGGRARIHSEHPDRRTYSAAELEKALPAEDEPKQAKWTAPSAASATDGDEAHHWFSRLSPQEQREEALEMLRLIPCRQRPSAEGGPEGTRHPALKVLGGLATQFGDDNAVELCHEAGWVNEWWDPQKELATFTHEQLTIGSVVSAAKVHGYKSPQDREHEQLFAPLKEKGNKADNLPPSVKGSWSESFDWMLDVTKTVEVLIEEALQAEAAETGSAWLVHQESFRRYIPERGYFQRVSHADMTRRIADLLRRVFEMQGKAVVRRQTTAAKATACCNWMAQTVAVEEVNTVTALAFRNGTVYPDGAGGWRRRDHSPANRLTYCIEGEWQENAECPPYFHEFVRTSYGLEWLQIIRAVFAYFADPRYSCRVFVLLVGLSGTGKGTLQRLLTALFPPETVTSISKTAQLDSPERVAQFIAGKRLITFPDMQGRQTDVGTLYNLTEKQTLTGRHLYSKETFELQFTGRVVMVSTQPPAFENAGTGAARRILTIPTQPVRLPSASDKLNSDEFNDLLLSEIGQVVSWALQMPTEEVEQVLQFSDPAGLLRDSADEMEVNMDATRLFIDRCLEPADRTVIPEIAELFNAYRLFSAATAHKGVCNENTFVARLRGALPHLHRPRRGVPGQASARKTPALFFGFRLVPGIWHKSESAAHAFFPDNQRTGRSSSWGVVGDSACPEIEKAPRGSEWGALLKTKLRNGGFAELKQHHPPEPSHEELVKAGIFAKDV